MSGDSEKGDCSPAGLDIAQGLVADDFEERSSVQSPWRLSSLLRKLPSWWAGAREPEEGGSINVQCLGARKGNAVHP